MDDLALLARVRNGEERAFAELFDRHARPVLAFARSRLTVKADADDVAQAAFVLLWEKRRTLELAGESALPWLLGAARLLALAASRAGARRGVALDTADDLADDSPGPDRVAGSSNSRVSSTPRYADSTASIVTSTDCVSTRAGATPTRRESSAWRPQPFGAVSRDFVVGCRSSSTF